MKNDKIRQKSLLFYLIEADWRCWLFYFGIAVGFTKQQNLIVFHQKNHYFVNFLVILLLMMLFLKRVKDFLLLRSV